MSEVDKKVQRLVVMIVYTFYTLVEKYFNFLFESAKNKILKNYKYAIKRGVVGEVHLPTRNYKFLVNDKKY